MQRGFRGLKKVFILQFPVSNRLLCPVSVNGEDAARLLRDGFFLVIPGLLALLAVSRAERSGAEGKAISYPEEPRLPRLLYAPAVC